MSEFEGVRSAVRATAQPAFATKASPGSNSGAVNGQSGSNLPSGPATSPPQLQQQAPARAEVEQSVAKIADYVQSIQRNLSFSVDESTGQMVMQVIDSETEQVIRQVPGEYALELAQNLKELEDLLSGSKGNLLEVRV